MISEFCCIVKDVWNYPSDEVKAIGLIALWVIPTLIGHF